MERVGVGVGCHNSGAEVKEAFKSWFFHYVGPED